MEWNRLDRHQSLSILEHVAIAADPNLFSKDSSEANFKPLPFYQDYMLYRVTNYATLPCFSLDFLSDGESFHLLDGTPSPIKLVNMKGSLYLSEATVIDYAEFYLSNLQADGGDIYFIREVEDLTFLGSLAHDQVREIEQHHEQPKAYKNNDSGGYVIEADIYYDAALLKSYIYVSDNGEIEIQPREQLVN